MSRAERLVVIGGACAGYTAAVYAGRADVAPLVFTGDQDGGQLALTSEVENFPGFPEGVLGPDLMAGFRKQAEKFGARIVGKRVTAVDFKARPFALTVEGGETVSARAVIVATGAAARWLGLPSEQKLRGKGVSACATCDGFFFRNKEIAVVGGGDSALEEAVFLTKFASKVNLIHRRDALRGSKIMQARTLNNPRIAVVWNSVVTEVLGESRVEGVLVTNVKTREVSTLPCQGLFLAIGHDPNTGVFRGHLELDEQGYIVTHEETRTSVDGVFAAGDVKDRRYRQAVTAAGSGCMAAIDATRYLEALESEAGK